MKIHVKFYSSRIALITISLCWLFLGDKSKIENKGSVHDLTNFVLLASLKNMLKWRQKMPLLYKTISKREKHPINQNIWPGVS